MTRTIPSTGGAGGGKEDTSRRDAALRREASSATDVIGTTRGGGASSRAWMSRVPIVPMVLTAGLALLVLCPVVRESAVVTRTFLSLAGGLLLWEIGLMVAARRGGRGTRVAGGGRRLAMEFVAISSHYVQGLVQGSIMVWWGLHASEVVRETPLILAQLMYLYCLEALLTWTRGGGRVWRVGFGPVPIVLSTNLLLWFKHDVYYLQFAMLTLGALGKQFITWNRERGPSTLGVGEGGVVRRTHIFNPSAFGQFVFAVGLIATGMTSELTWGERIAATFDAPHMLIVIFVGGLLVQSLFHVTLMTLAAVAVIYGFNLAYTAWTGVYFFVNVNIAASIFLGVHLLVTDPATSPRTNIGRVVFGALYGAGYLLMYGLLSGEWLGPGTPTFWDKLLPVPLLNLCVPMIERMTGGRGGAGLVGRLNHAWEVAASRRVLNLAHMAVWAGLFGTMLATGFIESREPHPGNSIAFWKRAMLDARAGEGEGKPGAERASARAAHGYLVATGAQAQGLNVADARNELGLIALDGTIAGVAKNEKRAAHEFALAAEGGSIHGTMNVATLFLFGGIARSERDAMAALDALERACARADASATPNANACYLLGYAYEIGRGRPRDRSRAVELYERCGPSNTYAARGLARLALTPAPGKPVDLTLVTPTLIADAGGGDEECHWYLAYMHDLGIGVRPDAAKAREHLRAACKGGAGLAKACEALRFLEGGGVGGLPAFSRPVITAPAFSSAYPVVSGAGLAGVASGR